MSEHLIQLSIDLARIRKCKLGCFCHCYTSYNLVSNLVKGCMLFCYYKQWMGCGFVTIYSYMQKLPQTPVVCTYRANYRTFSLLLSCSPYTCIQFSFNLPNIHQIYQTMSCMTDYIRTTRHNTPTLVNNLPCWIWSSVIGVDSST